MLVGCTSYSLQGCSIGVHNITQSWQLLRSVLRREMQNDTWRKSLDAMSAYTMAAYMVYCGPTSLHLFSVKWTAHGSIDGHIMKQPAKLAW